MHANGAAQSADGRRAEIVEYPARCREWAGASGVIELDHESRGLPVDRSQLWLWTVGPNLIPRKLTGGQVQLRARDRCIVALKTSTGEVEAVQAIRRLSGSIASRPSPSVGQIKPDDEFVPIAGQKVFVRSSEVAGVVQLPAVGERVEFQLALNPERADRLWAAEVTLLQQSTIANAPLMRTASSGDTAGRPAPIHAAGGVAGGGPTSPGADGAAAGSPTAEGALPAKVATSAAPAPGGEYQPGRRVYVGLLPADAGWRQLHELLAPLGEVRHVQVHRPSRAVTPTPSRHRANAPGLLAGASRRERPAARLRHR